MGETLQKRLNKLAVITTHPIQYNAPVFKLIHERARIKIKVFYTWGEAAANQKYDPGFDKDIKWDIPLLDGYDYTFVNNISTKPGSHHFKGIDNPTLIQEIEDWNPDTILVFGWCFKSHLKVIRFFRQRKKILFRGDSTLLDEEGGFIFQKIMRRLFLTWVYSHIDKALYVGSANKQYYLAHGLKNVQLVFAPHAIDNVRFMQGVAGFREKEMKIPKDAFVFMFTGKFEPKKNPRLLLTAFIRLADTKTHLLMVGNGELESQLKENTSQQPPEISSRIHFLPFQNQGMMPTIYKTGDVLVLPSKGPGETWGLSVNEAMACSKPVLVSDRCGCAIDLVKEGINGYTFKSNDGDDLLKKMERIIQERQKLSEMGKRSLEFIQPWRFENICEAVEQSTNS